MGLLSGSIVTPIQGSPGQFSRILAKLRVVRAQMSSPWRTTTASTKAEYDVSIFDGLG